MMRLLRVTDGQPATKFRFTENPGETPREVLERAQAAVRKALKGDAEPASSSAGGGSGQAAGTKAAGKGKGGKDGGWVLEHDTSQGEGWAGVGWGLYVCGLPGPRMVF